MWPLRSVLQILRKMGNHFSLFLSQPGALRHLALNRLHGEQCKRDEPARHICRQVKIFFSIYKSFKMSET